MSPVPPLTEAEECLWRGWVQLNAEMTMARQRDLQADGLSTSDFDVLVHLTDDQIGRAHV